MDFCVKNVALMHATQSNLVLSLKMYDWQVNEKELINERCKSEKLPPIVNARLQFDPCIF